MQILCKTFYEFTIPRYLKNDQSTVRPEFVVFDFSSIKQQIRHWLKEKYSSEAKSSDDELGRLLYARVWYYTSYPSKIINDGNLHNPWSFIQVRISPSLMTKGGFRTIVTAGRFRAFLIGGTNSKQTWEF